MHLVTVQKLIMIRLQLGAQRRLVRLSLSLQPFVLVVVCTKTLFCLCCNVSFLYPLLLAHTKHHLVPSIHTGFQHPWGFSLPVWLSCLCFALPHAVTILGPFLTWASQSLLYSLVFLTLSSSVRCLSLLKDIGYWVNLLALSFVLVVQYLLSPYSWSLSEVMKPRPAHLPFWKSPILSERQLAYPKLQLSGFITYIQN